MNTPQKKRTLSDNDLNKRQANEFTISKLKPIIYANNSYKRTVYLGTNEMVAVENKESSNPVLKKQGVVSESGICTFLLLDNSVKYKKKCLGQVEKIFTLKDILEGKYSRK